MKYTRKDIDIDEWKYICLYTVKYNNKSFRKKVTQSGSGVKAGTNEHEYTRLKKLRRKARPLLPKKLKWKHTLHQTMIKPMREVRNGNLLS